MKKIIIFYAPLGFGVSPDKIGGAEAGCLKTIEILKSDGFDIVTIHKPVNNRGLLDYFIKMTLLPLQLIPLLLKYDSSVLHIAGFYLKLASYEWLLMNIARILGHKVVYEIRNGGMIESYLELGSIYRYFVRNLVNKSSLVLCQGEEYMDFVREKGQANTTYYPNYVLDRYFTENQFRQNNVLNLVYVGRITKSKNLDIVIQTLSYLITNNYPAQLHLIGGYSIEYKAFLDEEIFSHKILPEQVIFYGRQDFKFIKDKLDTCHYFIFPSEEKREGHSNALTEAMACGVVPIVSNAGFNSSIVGIQDLVCESLSAQQFAEKVIKIERTAKWRELSDHMHQRIRNNFTERIVRKNLLVAINNLF